ncbi:TolB family protein [Coraliomargarita parva]|uniref:TolB family protein n=1 Tax=Coraliomargarita parva TaxID=3014050 RepID=UPI0022B58950|nr:hypothetical protein [Coraliomargarita parva]
MPHLDLELAPGWREVDPRADAPELLVEQGGVLRHLRGDFDELHQFGSVGPVDCPLAYDARSRRAYRYVCETRLLRKDFSQLRAYDLNSGGVFPLLELPLNQWVLWQLDWLPGKDGEPGQLFGLLASDHTEDDDRIVIQHRLFAFNPAEAAPRVRPLCRDAYKPLAFSRQRREMVFAGAEGIHVVGLKGERRVSLTRESRPEGYGASFDPQGGGRVALGGAGIWIWDYEAGSLDRLSVVGRHPVWSQDGRGIWYGECSSDLFRYDTGSGQIEKILGIRQNRQTETWHARPVRQSPCGRYLAMSLTAKRLKGVTRQAGGMAEREHVYVHHHALCILDLERRELWRREGAFVNQVRWV